MQKFALYFVFSSLIRIFATNHWRIPQWRAGVTFEGKI